MVCNVQIVSDETVWRTVLAELDSYDFVHTFDFHRASLINGEGEPVLFVVRAAQGRVLAGWPLLKRYIPGSSLFDLTSTYGYSGPLFAKGVETEVLLDELWGAMRSYGAVSMFSRMHPLYIENITSESYRGVRLSDVVVIPVDPLRSDVYLSYRGSHRREIVNARKKGVSIVVDWNCDLSLDFIKIYRDTMKEINASEYYFFSDAYFDAFVGSNDFGKFIIFAELNGVFIGASMFTVSRGIMQYYLSGTKFEYRKLAPSKLIVSSAHEIAASIGVNNIILGGGVGSARDALFDFKLGFSDKVKPFYICKKIFNYDIYQDLCVKNDIDPSATSFFPAYRSAETC